MVTLSAKSNPYIRTGLICLRAERDIRERRCIGFQSSIETSYTMPHAGVWEATAANGVAGVRRSIPAAKTTSAGTRGGMLTFRGPQKKTQNEPKIDEEGWEAWTMTASGIITIHPLQIDVLADRVGVIKPVGRNAVAVTLAEDIVLVQFGDRINDNDGDDNDDRLVTRRAPRARLTGRSKPG